jgi:hypothetical protein
VGGKGKGVGDKEHVSRCLLVYMHARQKQASTHPSTYAVRSCSVTPDCSHPALHVPTPGRSPSLSYIKTHQA